MSELCWVCRKPLTECKCGEPVEEVGVRELLVEILQKIEAIEKKLEEEA